MLCARPIAVPYTGAVPCGQCLPCRVNRQRKWAARLLLESLGHGWTAFATLTYDEASVRRMDGVPVLHREDYTRWLKRLRKMHEKHGKGPLRTFGVGEYGERTHRPHYHALLFGFHPLDSDLVHTTWGHGHTLVDDATPERMLYCARYTVKKLTQPGARGLHGRPPEFAAPSRRPGIGRAVASNLADANIHGNVLELEGDVCREFRMNGRKWPLDRYMVEAVRDELGVTDPMKREPPPQEWVDVRLPWKDVKGDDVYERRTVGMQKAREIENRMTRKKHGRL